VHAVVALNERIAQVVDAELIQTLQGTKVKVQVVRVSAAASRVSRAHCLSIVRLLTAASAAAADSVL
jgi:hypothetical protein